jgi:SAM-dependent methyltransferase
LPYYPRAVTQVYALDPARFAQQRAAARIVARGLPVQWLVSPESDSGRLPLPDQSVDTALSTFTLCTIPRVSEALAELRRVLKPRGSLHFLEHGRAAEPFWAQIQDLLDPLRRPLVGGCHLNRAIDVLLRDAGFCLNELKTYAVSGPKLSSYLYEGVACACAKGAGTAQETGC